MQEVSIEDLLVKQYNQYMSDEHFEAQFPDNTREEEIASLVSYIKEGSSCQLIGLPGVSRSTVLGFLSYNRTIREKHLGEKQSQIHFVEVDFSEIRNRPLFDVMKFLFLNLTESLRERGLKEENQVVGDKFREHLQFNDELVLFQGFKEAIDYMALQKKITVVFLLNRFEEYVPRVTSEFFSNLRILRNRAKYQFSVVFSLNRPLENLLEPQLLADYYEFVAGHSVYVRLHDEVFSRHRLSLIERVTGKVISKDLLEKIFALTGGHGKLTKLAVEATLSNDQKPQDLKAFLLKQKTITAALTEIWRSLLPSEQSDILEGTFEDKEVSEYLECVGLVKDRKLQIPLLADFVKEHSQEKPVSAQKIVFDQHTNTIRKGETVLSDQLTSSEFRVLAYLLQNEDRIVDREELISVVWSGVKSTAGITDQAVDQLIFRVRRKIEEDANHPAHLHTIKGRGFKFTA
jgi:DNA-binding winged helix-turn-helix (wHTH) protein